ncbi:hypothetical protein [Brevundimonas sp. LM2]|uniref:hypothetical protein n=1 Tax=Brevundimonas sp. LM2 TaxID=1938605 RepID=UPI00209A6818|nr:hypothetical protein [Brevundimonas sp. LM2]
MTSEDEDAAARGDARQPLWQMAHPGCRDGLSPLRRSLRALQRRRFPLQDRASGDAAEAFDPVARPIKPVYIRDLIKFIDELPK